MRLLAMVATSCFGNAIRGTSGFLSFERVSPDMSEGDVIRLEATWKERLHTRSPHGLNDN